jgi:uncharacterized protein DUF5996
MDGSWPGITPDESSRRLLHMAAQMVGKTRLALAPPQPEWLNACLFLDARGLTTGAIPTPDGVATIAIDLLDPAIWVRTSGGHVGHVGLAQAGSVAQVWSAYQAALDSAGIVAPISSRPQEVGDVPAFEDDTDAVILDPAYPQALHAVLAAVDAPFEAFRSRFFGRSGIQFWWGSFDFCVLLFNGRHTEPPRDRGFILRHDLDAEHLNAGFWPGDSSHAPQFFAYIVPEPPGCETVSLGPTGARWSTIASEWTLPYQVVRGSDDPTGTVLTFLDGVRTYAEAAAGWDARLLSYKMPAMPQS